MDTPIEYPTLTLSNGETVTVKFSKAAFYRMSKSGFDLSRLGDKNQTFASYAVIIDLLHIAVADQIKCTPDQLADLIENFEDAVAVIGKALEKIQPLVKTTSAAPAAIN